MFKLFCNKNDAYFQEVAILTSGRVGEQISFTFSPDWDRLLKTAVFIAGKESRDVVLTEDTCNIPPEVLVFPGENLRVGVFGETADKTLVIPTIYASAGIIRPGASPSGMSSTPPTPSWPEQVQAIATEAKNVADSVRSDAEAGKFAGPEGKAGGYYTPAVTQPDENTPRVAFTPSKEDMPAIEPADIAIPTGGGSGTSGEDGGYYAPSVDDEGNLTWTASKTDMPAVDGANIKGPKGDTGPTGPKGDTGAAGEAGGYYTPAITQPDENTLRVAFTPSKEDMPAVADTDITLSAGGNGLTAAQINALDGMFKVCAFIKADISAEYNEFCTAFDIEAAAITGISATYSGGSVPAGTALDDLTGIVVTAQYSDGSTATVTGYTLSGEIAEGSNTITVTYQDKTATFTVTGTAAAQVYTVTNNLTNVTNSNSQTEVTDGFYSATLTVSDGYSMQSVVITMGGVDVTDSVYGEGGILITEVTGDIVITAVAGVALAYALPEPLTFAGTGNAAYDTGYAMYPDGDKDVSICVDFSAEAGPNSNVTIISSGVTYGYQLWHNGARIFRVRAYQNDAVTDIFIPCENARLVWTIAKGEKVHYAYALKNDAVTQYTGSGYDYSLTASTATTKIGTSETTFKGTIHDFRVYDQLLSDAQIEAYLRGGTI